MNILNYCTDPRFSSCLNAFVATGKQGNKDLDQLNRGLLSENKTGYWIIEKNRIKFGDAMFLLLPDQEDKKGYPREFFGGVVNEIILEENNRTVVSVKEFFQLPKIEKEISEFLMGNRPPQGNTVLKVWDADILIDSEVKPFDDKVQISLNDNRESRLKRLEKARRLPNEICRSVKAFDRNPDVKAEALLRANGICGDCGNEGPFITKTTGKPFLEVHHIVRLAYGGEDTVANTISLCPNCHRRRHYESENLA